MVISFIMVKFRGVPSMLHAYSPHCRIWNDGLYEISPFSDNSDNSNTAIPDQALITYSSDRSWDDVKSKYVLTNINDTNYVLLQY